MPQLKLFRMRSLESWHICMRHAVCFHHYQDAPSILNCGYRAPPDSGYLGRKRGWREGLGRYNHSRKRLADGLGFFIFETPLISPLHPRSFSTQGLQLRASGQPPSAHLNGQTQKYTPLSPRPHDTGAIVSRNHTHWSWIPKPRPPPIPSAPKAKLLLLPGDLLNSWPLFASVHSYLYGTSVFGYMLETHVVKYRYNSICRIAFRAQSSCMGCLIYPARTWK